VELAAGLGGSGTTHAQLAIGVGDAAGGHDLPDGAAPVATPDAARVEVGERLLDHASIMSASIS
jgi:hypothetical protein